MTPGRVRPHLSVGDTGWGALLAEEGARLINVGKVSSVATCRNGRKGGGGGGGGGGKEEPVLVLILH